jgi:hypothetical protein
MYENHVPISEDPDLPEWREYDMPDFTRFSVVDNHCHVIEPEKKTIGPIWLTREFFYGIADISIPGVAESELWGVTDELLFHFPHMGVVLTTVCQLAKLFGCDPELVGDGYCRAEPSDGRGRSRQRCENMNGLSAKAMQSRYVISAACDSDKEAVAQKGGNQR